MSIDLYAIYGLDRQQSPETLAQQLERQLAATDPSNTLARGRIETAKAVLGDPSRRTVYDQRLADPAAPPVTEQVLAALAGKPVPSAPSITLTSLLASTQGKLIAGGAATLVLILLVVIAVAAASGGDDGGSDSETSAQATTAQRASIANPDLSRVSMHGTKNQRLEQQIITTGTLDLTDVVTELGFQDAKGDRYTGPENSADRNGWPPNPYSTQLLLLDNGQVALRWHCDAGNMGPRSRSTEFFCDGGGYLVLLDPGEGPGELPQVAEVVSGPWDELDMQIHTEIGNDTVKSRMWPGYHPYDSDPRKIMVDETKEPVIAAVQPDMDEPMVYFVKPGSFNLYVGEMAEIPKQLQDSGN